MKKKTTKIISIILSVLLIFSVMPMTVLASDSVASVTTVLGEVTEFATLVEAIDYACANVGSTLTLLSDAEVVDKEFHIIDCDFTLDLNGKTLSSTTAYEIIRIHRGGKLTVKDSVGTGVITCADSDKNSNAILHCGELVVEGGTFIGKDYAVVSCDKIIVKDGTFVGDKRGLEIIRSAAVSFACTCELLEKRHGEYLNGSGQLFGGTFVGGITINNYGRWDDVFGPIYISDYLPEGFGFFAEDGSEIFVDIYDSGIPQTVTIKESNNERPNVAKVELATGTTEYFIDIRSAFYYAENWAGRVGNHNPKVVLLKDVELTGMIDFDGWNRSTIDLNGKTLSSSGGITLDVQECTITDSVGGGAIVNTAESNGTAVKCSKTVLDGVNIKSNSHIGVSAGNNTTINTITINNCKIEGKTNSVKCNYRSSLNLKDSVLIGEEYGIYIFCLGNINVDDCTISGGTKGLYYEVSSTTEHANICLSDCTIYGGMERSHKSQDFSKMVAEGYEIYDTDDNVIDVETRIPANEFPHIVYEVEEDVVIKNKFPVSVIQPDGTTEYFPSVDEGLNSANKDIDSILKLLTDILLNSSLTFDGTTTLDLNGKTIEVKDAPTILVENGATVSIVDTADNGTVGGGGVAVNGGTLNFDSGNIESTMDGIYNNNGDVTVNGGSISSEYGYDDIFVDNEGTTKIYGGTFEDGFSIWGATINEALGENYAFYSADGFVEIDDDQIEISDNVVVYEKTIVTAMSSQIRFNKNDDGSYAGTFDVRTRAKITDADFNKYIASSNEDAAYRISKVGFVYAQAKNGFDINVAKTVAQGGQADGFVDAPVSYIQDADGYYMFTCLVTGIPEDELDNGLIAYAYICLDDTWYFFPVEVTAEFGELYNTYYPIAAEQYGWEV